MQMTSTEHGTYYILKINNFIQLSTFFKKITILFIYLILFGHAIWPAES